MPSTTIVTTAMHSTGSAYTSSLREQAKEEMKGEDWSKYSAKVMLNAIKNLGVRARAEEEAGNLAEAYIMYYKATDLLSRILNHPEFQKSQKEKSAVWQEFKAYETTFGPTIMMPATKLSERLKAIEQQKIDKVDRRDTPIMPGTPLPFTLPVSPPSTGSGPSTPDPPMSPTSQAPPRSIADRLSMLRQNGLPDATSLNEISHSGSLPQVNGKRISRESAKSSTSPNFPSTILPAHTGPSTHTRLADIPSLLPSAPILPSAPTYHPASTQAKTPSPPTHAVDSARRPPPPIQTESEFDNTFPTLSALEATFPTLPSVPTELPGLPSVPSHRPGSSSISGMPPSRPESRPRASPKPLSPHTSGSPTISHGRPPSVSSVRSHPTGGARHAPIPTAITPKELHAYLKTDTHSILLLDIREQSEYLERHIAIPATSRSARVQLEPTLIMRPSLSSLAIEAALSLNPPEEADAFMNRAKYSIVVMCDEASTNVGQSVLMQTVVRVIWENEFADRKKLDRPPIVLVGGLKAWKKELGDEGLEGTDVDTDTRTNGRVEQRQENGRLTAIDERRTQTPHRERVETLREERGRSSLDQLPNRIWTPPQAPLDENGERSPLARKPAISRSQGTTRLANMYREGDASPSNYSSTALASPTISPAGYTPSYQSFYNNPSGAASAGGLYRSMAPVPEGTQLPTPPQASAIPPTSMARRRTDYAELAQYPYSGAPPIPTSRPSIDYPQLNVHAAPIITHPPAVASSSMERHDVRPLPPPRPGAQYNQEYQLPAPTNAVSPQPIKPATNGYLTKAMISAPRIISEWPVQFWADQAISASGLKNLGNTCYMNAPLQCLSATVPFARFFLENRWQKAVNTVNPLGTHGQLAGAFAKIIQEMWQASYTYLSPVNFRRSVCQYARQFAGADQHDAQEFISFLLDGLHEDLNRILRKPHSEDPTPEREEELETLPQQIAGEQEWQLYQTRDDSIVVDYFQGQFRNRMQCLTCAKTSTTYNSFMYLSLPIPTGRGLNKVTLQQCLDAFVKDEIMEKEDAWMCPNCKVLRKATKRLSISRLPPVLLIHLKRFSIKGPFVDKLETLVEFPLKNLDLTNYMPPPLPPGADKGLLSSAPVRLDDPRAQIPPYRYDLYAVTNHFGSLSSGHYTAFIASKGSWVYCDDSRLSNAEGREIVAKPAYILFYKRVSR